MKTKMKSKFTQMSPAEQDKSKTVKFHDDPKHGVTVCKLYDRWYGRKFIGMTRCLDTDQYSKETGRAIAFNKARRAELRSDIALIEYERDWLTRQYEDNMARLDKNQGIKQIYLAGVEDELKELMFGANYEDEYLYGDDSTTESADTTDNALINVESNKEDINNIKLTQFANFIETEI